MALSSAKTYRSDIDGLRGVAVLAVIFFHIDSQILPGGFVGVDIFFVISGYLISLHIFTDIERGRFSLVEFYRRRIKRIAPAMLAVVAATLVLTQFFFVPDDAKTVAQSAFFSLASLANVYFWLFQDTSYFAAASNEQPLLHLWSLGVEEQFYIVWPLLLMTVYSTSRARRFTLVAVIVAAASYFMGDVLFARAPGFVYYMLPTRAGELLLGALAAQWVMRRGPEPMRGLMSQAAGAIGLSLIVWSCFTVSETDAFPGWRAIPPTVGTAVVILTGNNRVALSTRLLSWRPLVWVGLISYSAYLWHWPLLAFARYFGIQIDALSGTVVFIATLTIAWLSYRYIEQPARRAPHSALQVAWRQYIAPAGLLAVLCLVSVWLDGYGPRWFLIDLRQRLAAAERETRPAYQYDHVCQRFLIEPRDLRKPECVVGFAAKADPPVLLWGDSNAAQYVGMLSAFAETEGFSFRNVAISGCPPILADPTDFVPAARTRDCSASLEAISKVLVDYPIIWIAANWTAYESKSGRFMVDFEKTVRRLIGRGHRVVILGKAPVIDGYDRRCWQKAITIPFIQCETPSVPLAENVRRMNFQLESLAREIAGADYFDANAQLCVEGRCSVVDELGRRMYFDKGHISMEASRRLGEKSVAHGVPEQFHARTADRVVPPIGGPG